MMADFIDGELTSLAFCWRLERADGAGLGLTGSDRDITHGGTLYRSAPGMTPAAITRSAGLEPATGEVAGALSADCLSETDLELGRWDGARISLFAVDWTDPEAEPVTLLAGQLCEVSIEGDGFSTELRGAAARLTKPPCPLTSPECRAAFGDKQCRVDLAGRTRRATVVSATGNSLELDQPADDTLLFGRLRYLSGLNAGATTSVLAADGTTVMVRDRPRSKVETGTVVELREGCDKRLETCASRFHNAINFRGEPHLPGADLLTRYPGA